MKEKLLGRSGVVGRTGICSPVNSPSAQLLLHWVERKRLHRGPELRGAAAATQGKPLTCLQRQLPHVLGECSFFEGQSESILTALSGCYGT